jgi:hypothetical protein
VRSGTHTSVSRACPRLGPAYTYELFRSSRLVFAGTSSKNKVPSMFKSKRILPSIATVHNHIHSHSRVAVFCPRRQLVIALASLDKQTSL